MPMADLSALIYNFFSPQGSFEACGMFTYEHIIASVICLTVVTFLLISRKKNFRASSNRKIIQCFAIILTLL